MKHRIILTEASVDYVLQTFKELTEKTKWEVVYITAHSNYVDFSSVQAKFPNAIIHENYEAVKGIPGLPYQNETFEPIDSELINAFQKHKTIVLTMMDRMDPMNIFNHQERVRLYYQYLRYWLHVIDDLKPTLLFSPVSPHLCYDFILYQLCKHKNIKCILLHSTRLPYRVYITNSYTSTPSYLKNHYAFLLESPKLPKITEESKTYLNKLRNKSYLDALPNYMVEQSKIKKEKKVQDSFLSKIIKEGRLKTSNIKHTYFTKKLLSEVSTYYKKEGITIEQGSYNQKEYKKYINTLIAKNKIVEQKYNSLISPVDYNQSYVLLALMYQPERTTSPDGGIFVDQYLMIEWLSNCLPEGWLLYIKEHPSQYFFSYNTRRTWFYDDIIRFDNVRLISTKEDTFRLIDNSKAVATIAGTIGFESVVRLKPVLCFGYIWYMMCRGIYEIRTLKDLKQAIKTIEEGILPNSIEIEKFVQAIEEKGIHGYIENYEAKGFDFNTNIKNLSEGIEKFIKSKKL